MYYISPRLGVFKEDGPYDIFINVRHVREFNEYSVSINDATQRAHDAIITFSLRPNDVVDVVLT